MSILGALGSVFSGGVTGLIGVGIKAFSAYKMKKLEYEHQQRMEELSLKSMQLEKELKLQMADKELDEMEVQKEIEESKVEGRAFIESYKHDEELSKVLDKNYSKYGKFGLILEFFQFCINALRASVRPITTYYFDFFLFYIFIKVYRLVGGLESIPQDKLMELFIILLNSILFCGTTVILWWYGSRKIDKIFGIK